MLVWLEAQAQKLQARVFYLLDYMRSVLLQDAAVLCRLDGFKHHTVFQHPLFKTDSFSAFQKSLLTTMSDTPQPEGVLLKQSLPLVAEGLDSLRKDSVIVQQQLLEIKDSLTERQPHRHRSLSIH